MKTKDRSKISRIYIMGPPGSGKTSFAKRISHHLKIPNFDLDNITFRKDKYKKISPAKRDKKLKNIIKNKSWVIEGSYAHSWIYPAIKRAKLIIILKKPFNVIAKRIVMRYIRRKIKIERAEKGAGTLKELLKLINYAQTYPEDYFVKHLSIAKKFKIKTIVFTKKSELNEFIESI
jgi:adenylate kinase family enzyme